MADYKGWKIPENIIIVARASRIWNDYKRVHQDCLQGYVVDAENKEMRLFLYRKDANGNLSYITETQFGSYGHTAATLATEAGAIRPSSSLMPYRATMFRASAVAF